jgi:uncharacterized protein (DUF58 family)
VVSSDTLRKVRRIEITTRRLVDEVVGGEYHSVFKGRGMEFAEVREYIPGDDVRTIDWNVTARAGRPFVKKFVEERELTVMFLVDGSGSTHFGTAGSTQAELAAEISAVLAFSAIKNNDKVGLIIFSEDVELYVPPRKGRRHVLRVIREVLGYRTRGRGTDLAAALEYLGRVVRRKCVVFVISDFLSPDYENALRLANRRHDVIALSVTDPRVESLSASGHLWLADAETGEEILVDTGDARFRRRYEAARARWRAECKGMFQRAEVDHVEVSTDRSFTAPLIAFFKSRERKRALTG